MKLAPVIAGLFAFAIGSGVFASRLWPWVVNFDPGFVFEHAPVPTGPALTPRVTILLIDGLRLDESRRMKALNALRAQGADIEAQVGTPSFSRPGRATIAVGAPPSIHGVTTNRQKRELSIDNLIRRVGATGGTCRIAGSRIWSGLFAADIARCGLFRQGESKEGPGTFVSNIAGVRASEKAGLVFALEQEATLRIADIVSTDFAAHEYGGTSPEYQAEVQRADANLADLLSHLDLSRETIVVTADHGHRDLGGHGGEEKEVLAIPIVMAGVGIKPAVRANALQADIAPTVAALLGAALPTGSSGHPIDSILLADETKLAQVRGASEAQRTEFEKAVALRLGAPFAPDANQDWRDIVRAHRALEMGRRIPTAGFLWLMLLGLVVLAIFRARPDASGLIASVGAGIVLCAGPIRVLLPGLSFSVINYDETVVPFFRNIMEMASAALLIVVGVGLFVRSRSRSRRSGSAAGLAGSAGLLWSAVLAAATIADWLHHGLLSPLTFPGPDLMVKSFALTLSLTSVSATSLLAMSVAALISARTSKQSKV